MSSERAGPDAGVPQEGSQVDPSSCGGMTGGGRRDGVTVTDDNAARRRLDFAQPVRGFRQQALNRCSTLSNDEEAGVR
jgi:hypothetical protein